MGIPKDIVRSDRGLSDWCIMSCYRGSIAQGLYSPNFGIDDKDAMAVCVPPLDYFFGLRQYGSRGTKEIKKDEWDIVIYEIRKIISLLAKGNPNVLMTLWLEDKNYMLKTSAWQILIDNRNVFATKQIYHSFIGYAHGQSHRMTHHTFLGYMGERRKELVSKFGYDVKNAVHLIMLLRQGIEFLTDGILYVERPDAQQLLEIKRGEWSLEKVKAEADRLFISAEQAYINSKLPVEIDKNKVNGLCVEMVQVAHQLQGQTGGRQESSVILPPLNDRPDPNVKSPSYQL